MADFNQLASSYEQAAREADALIARRLYNLLVQLRTYASSIARRKTGRMARSLHVDGPVRRVGRVEGAVVAGVVYAEFVVALGEDADYAGRTLREQDALIQQWADETNVQIVRKVGGVS